MEEKRNEVTADEISVEVKGRTYVFKVPSPLTWAAVGVRARDLRRSEGLPTSSYGDPGDEDGLDIETILLFRGMALLERLLIRTDATWVGSSDAKGMPVVDSKKFPSSAIPTIVEIAQRFNESLREFHEEGTGSNQSGSAEAVAGQPNPTS